VGSWLAEDWGFPSEYREITGHHHEPPRSDRFDLQAAVHLGCRIADMLGFQVAGPAPLVGFEELKAEFPACSWERVKPEHELLHEIAGRINALECSLL
jgi:hypothetical protein